MSDVHDEFLAEAQEIIEALSRDLLFLDQAQKEGNVQPDLINEVFRGVHTLKGIAGMFGFQTLSAMAHTLEDLLDDLRLGRVQLSQEVLDVLFEGVEGFQRLLGEGADQEAVDVKDFAQSIERVSKKSGGGRATLEELDLDESVLAVLTEYEEHRLRTNVTQGTPLYRLRVRFSLTTIDSNLEELKERAKSIAEIITYLPSVGGGDGDEIDLDVLLASSAPANELGEVLAAGGEAELELIRRKGVRKTSHEALVPPPIPIESEPPRRPTPTSRPPAPVHTPAPPPKGAAGVPRDMSADALSLRSVANTVRVDIRKLDHLMNVVGELAIVRSAVARITERIRSRDDLRQLAIELHRVNRGFERHLEELQDGILDVRMVPLGQLFDKLARIIRQVAREHDKEVRLLVTGAETEVDKLIVEELSDPLMHLIRNAIDHGIESPKVRELAGKGSEGILSLNAYQKGNHVVLEIEDDGAGMNEEMLVQAAIRKGIISRDAAEEITSQDALELIFMPGFSTRSAITDLSGRGVGMDVVKTNINRLGGVVDVWSDHGSGTKFTITLPVTLAIISALLVRVAGRDFAIPITSVQEAILLDRTAVRTVEGREVISLRGATLPLCRLDHLFRLLPVQSDRRFVVVCAVGQRRVGFVVDGLDGQQDIVIKALGKSLRDVRGFAGATDLGDQRVALVLDAPGLLEEVLRSQELPSLGAEPS
ncbi:MAG: chemotaxis protein CheA [Deltaproteobacteria bacterium]|nr:chemotaxis protein CheA [Deltaproteobacteria bacterium]